MEIRRATDEDWGAMRQVFCRAAAAAWPHLFPAEVLATFEPPERWRASIADPRQAVWVALQPDVRGFIVVRSSGDADADGRVGEVDSFYTDPSVWGQGAGRALMEAAVGWLEAADFVSATLWTERRNHRARAFYERSGWFLDGTVCERQLRGTDLIEDRFRLLLPGREN